MRDARRNCLILFQNYFRGLIAANTYFPTKSSEIFLFQNYFSDIDHVEKYS